KQSAVAIRVASARAGPMCPTIRRRSATPSLEELGPDVVVVHDALAFPHAVARWARERGVAVALRCHSDLALAARGLPGGLRAPAGGVLSGLQARALTAPAGVVMVASGCTGARIAGHSRAPVVISPLGVDDAVFRTASADPALRASLVGPRECMLLYAGRLSSEKRVDLLAPMLAHLPQRFVLVMAGAGAAGPRLRAAAARLGVADRLRMVGHIGPARALATLMATADCFVHPNPDEPFGLCPIEARATGCPVVVPRGSGAAEVLAGRGAVVVDPADASALARGVLHATGAPPGPADLTDLSWDATFTREWALYAGLTPCA
ncbi:MAG: glycosyltransferase, partial [Miltoncostaeaceae bacterium]